ncbi:MAG: hypothetical protein AAF542_18010 [Pseudomonadota bacterium]
MAEQEITFSFGDRVLVGPEVDTFQDIEEGVYVARAPNGDHLVISGDHQIEAFERGGAFAVRPYKNIRESFGPAKLKIEIEHGNGDVQRHESTVKHSRLCWVLGQLEVSA